MSYLLNPFLWILVLLIFSLFLYRKRNSRKLLFASVIMMIVFSNSFIIDEFMRWWEVPVRKVENLDRTYEVGVVLGGNMVTYDAVNDRRTYRNNIDRLLQAVELYKQGVIKRILVSGGAGNLVYPDMLESVFIRDFLLQIGIDSSHILIDSLSDNTRQNAIYSSDILREAFPGEKYLLITSAIHMKRAAACFEKAGLQVDQFSTNKYAGPRRFNFEFLFIPDPVNFVLWDLWIHEVLGYLVYAIMGYL